jgi:NTE family protein
VTDDKFLLLKIHGCANGLADEVIHEIAQACELVRCQSGEVLHRANQPFHSVYLIVHGRIRQSLIDIQGNVAMERQQTAGGQIGALAAALGEPSPIELVAEEPTTLLKLGYPRIVELTKKHDLFREKFSRMVAETMRDVLLKDRRRKKPGIVAIFHQSSVTRPLTRRLLERLQRLGENPSILSDLTDWRAMEGIPHYCLIQRGHHVGEQDVRQQINDWSDCKRVFIDVDAAAPSEKAAKVIEFSEKVLWCVTPENWKASIAHLRTIAGCVPGWREKIDVVWLLPADHTWAPSAPEFRELCTGQFKLSFEPPPQYRSREIVNGFERIIHHLRGVRIGVALGGGAARGMAHLGVLKVLEQEGIVIDLIAGTSAGAMTGVLYASGLEPDYNVQCFIKDLTPSRLLRKLPNGGYWYLLHKYRLGRFDPMLRKYLKESQLEQLAIPVQTITVDLVSGQAIVRSEGDAVHAITESINLPGLASPINRNGQALVDGGIINNVPANVLVKNGCNLVIAVSVTATLQPEFAKNRPDTPTPKMSPASTLQTLMRTFLVQNVNMNSVGVQPADFVIQPDVAAFGSTEFTRADEMSTIGQVATHASLPQLKQLLAQVDPQLFA